MEPRRNVTPEPHDEREWELTDEELDRNPDTKTSSSGATYSRCKTH